MILNRTENIVLFQVGTCKMGPSTDAKAVVNPSLQVYGIDRLRVVDASISKFIFSLFKNKEKHYKCNVYVLFFAVPDIPAAHTNAVVFMIGEKAADMVKDAWS